jgi:Protein of unknown function (DUF2442)
MLELVQAEYLDGYRLKLSFNSGESGVVDLTDSLWGPVFEPLRDVQRFKRFHLSPVLHTIAWDNEADFAPEYLRDKMIEQTEAVPTLCRQ